MPPNIFCQLCFSRPEIIAVKDMFIFLFSTSLLALIAGGVGSCSGAICFGLGICCVFRRKKFVGQRLGVTPNRWLTPKRWLLIWNFVDVFDRFRPCERMPKHVFAR